jgi:hypothetical protein
MRFLVLILSILATPAWTENICDELWLTRNQVFEQAGYCFGSTLGKAVFGTAGCTTKSPTVSGAAEVLIDQVKQLEAQNGCKVDTTRQTLDIPLLNQRLALSDLPLVDPFESACIGWRGGELPLFPVRSAEGIPFGSIRRGDTIRSAHQSAEAWDFVIIQRAGQDVVLGWTPGIAYDADSCDALAG